MRLNELHGQVNREGREGEIRSGNGKRRGNGNPADGGTNNVDLIVIATHGMTGWHRLAFGSVAEKVVRMAGCPVLVLRAEAVEKPAEARAAAVSG